MLTTPETSLLTRRDLLRTGLALGAAAPLATTATTLFAAPAAPARVLVVFLRGGYDAANLLVPVASNDYYAMRPNIAVARPGTAPDAAIALDADWGLHPALAASVMPLYAKGQAAFLPFAGTDDLSRSHFETQDSIELGQPLAGEATADGARRDFRSGFLNRLAGVLGDSGRDAIAFTDQLPLVLRGSVPVPNLALASVGRGGLGPQQSSAITAMYKGNALENPVAEGFAVRSDAQQAFAGEMVAANRNAVTARGFAVEARRIGRLMRDRYRLGFVDVGGWDTHVNEGGGSGYLAGRLGELGSGLAALSEELGEQWRDTVVVVVSEFGRTFRENGNRGTDHGHGSTYWVLGGAVRGGVVRGEQVKVAQPTLFQNRDYPVLNEYRGLLGGVFSRLYDLDAARVAKVFPGSRGARDLQLV